jgi:hypothetical protein
MCIENIKIIEKTLNEKGYKVISEEYARTENKVDDKKLYADKFYRFILEKKNIQGY